MANKNQTVNEAQLKARRTSLGKKTNLELINIILRKDKSERSLNAKIQELTKSLNNCQDTINTKNAEIDKLNLKISNFNNELNDVINTKQEVIDSLSNEKHTLNVENDALCNSLNKLTRHCNIFRNTLIGFVIIYIITLLCLDFC